MHRYLLYSAADGRFVRVVSARSPHSACSLVDDEQSDPYSWHLVEAPDAPGALDVYRIRPDAGLTVEELAALPRADPRIGESTERVGVYALRNVLDDIAARAAPSAPDPAPAEPEPDDGGEDAPPAAPLAGAAAVVTGPPDLSDPDVLAALEGEGAEARAPLSNGPIPVVAVDPEADLDPDAEAAPPAAPVTISDPDLLYPPFPDAGPDLDPDELPPAA